MVLYPQSFDDNLYGAQRGVQHCCLLACAAHRSPYRCSMFEGGAPSYSSIPIALPLICTVPGIIEKRYQPSLGWQG